MYKTVNWKTGPAAMRFRLKKNKKRIRVQAPKRVGPPNKESGFKRPSLTGLKPWDIIGFKC